MFLLRASKYQTIDDVVAWRACVGCGACAYLGGPGLAMQHVDAEGYRPVRTGQPLQCPEAELLNVCPGVATEIESVPETSHANRDFMAASGPVLEIWEGHATDPEIRFAGASGGALSALSAYCLERGNYAGSLHLGPDPDDPFLNKPFLSRTVEDLRRNSGSRYAPGSVCDGLNLLNGVEGSFAFIGQPSEVTALRKLQAVRTELRTRIGIALSFFCAGSPSSEGTLELIRSRGIDPNDVASIRYRGRGWPGHFAVWVRGKTEPVLQMTYAESWAFLQRYRPWSVQIWPDGSGEHADITCGDPWYRTVQPGEGGSSLIVARTEAGRRLVRAAKEAGYVSLAPLSGEHLVASQKNLISKKGAVWGRLWAMRLMGLPTPCHRGYGLFRMWLKLPVREKAASFIGTWRRILQRKYHKPRQSPVPSAPRPAAVEAQGL